MTKETLLKKLNGVKLKKVRSKMIAEALVKGTSVRGNHKIDYIVGAFDQPVFAVFYRGTMIAEVELGVGDRLWICPVYAGEFEKTPATMRQREELKEAVAELQEAIVDMKVVGLC